MNIIDIKTSNGMYKITVMTINFILRKNIYTVLNFKTTTYVCIIILGSVS